MVTTNWHKADANGDTLSDRELAVLSTITESFDQHPGFRHTLWEWLAAGQFELSQLQSFSAYYYGHVRLFRKYLAGAITVCSIESVQATLADILAEEYGRRFDQEIGTYGPSHPELYRRFMRSISMAPEELETVSPVSGVKHYQDIHYRMFQSGRELETMGAVIFGMESTTPFRHERVASGLRTFAESTGLQIDDVFFSRHIEVDPRHGQSLLMPVRAWLNDPLSVARLMKGAEESFDARKVLLDDIQSRIGI